MRLHILPLHGSLVFPGPIVPLSFGRQGSVRTLEDAVKNELPVGLLAQRNNAEEPGLSDLYTVGTLAQVMRMATLPDGQRQILVHGRQRFRILSLLESTPVLRAEVEILEQKIIDTQELRARVKWLREQARRAISLLPRPAPELEGLIAGIEDPVLLCDFIASSLDVPLAEKQAMLETLDLNLRMQMVSENLARQIEILDLTKKISEDTKGALDREQREYFLREQLRTIRRELGEEDGRGGEAEELRRKVTEAHMPAEVEKQAVKEIAHLSRIPESSGEYAMLRAYLDWLIELPWNVTIEEPIEIPKARAILDEDHYDLEKVKRRILEYLAVRKLHPEGKSPILCFAGPPGVGKTSLGQSIARATGRRFVRQSLGGVHDEAEIRGHRRTYVGALPGRIILGIRRAGSRNPVFMLDEIDKLGQSFHGDPAAALLEVLDPEQNFAFEDHYLGVPFDLRQVMFICTANVLYSIRGPLRDRMEVIELPGYTEEDKLAIAMRYLVPRQMAQNGLREGQLQIPAETVREVIRAYTSESGLRQLERQLGAICRGVAVRIAEGTSGPITVLPGDLRNYLGVGRYLREAALRTSLSGVATGLAWTSSGGDILFIEATRTDGNGQLLLTGQLGDVMKESAQAALSLIKSRAAALGISSELLRKSDIHMHIPAGAIPKDGPSAGVAIFTALASLFTGRRVRHDVAMTGEITLRGLILPVGGIKEKVLAARRAGISRVLLPLENRADFEEDIPAEVSAALEVHFLKTVDEALELALVREPLPEATPSVETEAQSPLAESKTSRSEAPLGGHTAA